LVRLGLCAAVAVAVGAAPIPVLAGKRSSEEGPAANRTWLAWMQSAVPNPRPPESRTAVWARPRDGGAAFRVNPSGTYAETGGLTGDTLAIQLVRHNTSRIALVDLRSRKVRVLGPWLGKGWLWRPSLSGDRLLFGRIDYAHGRYDVVLADLRRRTLRTLTSVSGHGAYAAPGQVNGPFAVWISCPDNVCSAFRNDAVTGKVMHLPNGDKSYYLYWQFGPSVTRSGVVYFGRGRHCADVQLLRYDGRSLRTLLRFPPDTAFQYSYADDTGSGVSVYYDRVGCRRTDLSDVYRLDDR
jgi:hypothetical protein